ncbi:MAG TPA: alpha/beta hydrolase [Acidimicrobiales bacterium]|nr:alpha/beta hydrolase [Acidimicrobiales bacterium]
MATVPASVTLSTGLTLSYAHHGDPSGQAVVLLPGPTDSWRSYRFVLDRLPSSIYAVAVSQRGHGDSDKPSSGYRVEDFAADVCPLLDALDIEKPVLVGHSGSCLVARRFAINHPDRVAGLVLEASPTTLRNDPGLTDYVESVVSRLEDPIDPGFARALVVSTSSDALAPETIDELVDESLKVPARVWRETFAGLLHNDDLAELGGIKVPTQLIWGDADTIVGAEMQELLLARISHASLLTYAGVGHTPRWEDPERFAGDVAAFIP